MPFLFLSISIFSCDKIDEPDILGGFVSATEVTDPKTNQIVESYRSILFKRGGEVEVFRSDLKSKTTFKIKGNKILIVKNEEFPFDLSFKVLDNNSLKEIGNNSIWSRIVFD